VSVTVDEDSEDSLPASGLLVSKRKGETKRGQLHRSVQPSPIELPPCEIRVS